MNTKNENAMTPCRQNRAFEQLLRMHRHKPKDKKIPTASELDKRDPFRVVARMCEALNVSVVDVLGKSHERDVVSIRFIIANHLRNEIGLTLHKTGQLMNRDHSSIAYYVRQYNALTSIDDPGFRRLINKTGITLL